MAMSTLILPEFSFRDDSDVPLVIQHSQEISDDFLQVNKEKREASSTAKMGDFHQMASIPTVVIEQWMREGFNIFDKNVTAKEIVARLTRDNLQSFLTSNKRV